jgi:hypothetical protein
VNGKVLQRSKNQQYIEDNTLSAANNQQTYKKRQAIVEHPFGTIKRQWGFDHIRTKKLNEELLQMWGLSLLPTT